MTHQFSQFDSQHRWPMGGFIGVLISVIVIFLIIPLFATSYYSHLALQSSFVVLILSTIYAIGRYQMAQSYNIELLFCCSLVTLFILLNGWSVTQNSLYWMVAAYCVYCIFLFFAIIVLCKRVLAVSFINTNVIFGAITIYLLSGILWSRLYFIAEAIWPQSFHGISALDLTHDSLDMGYHAQFDLLYFSFTTITTLGEGDITPMHHLTKSLTIMEAVFGQLFTAIVIAKMVSTWHHRR